MSSHSTSQPADHRQEWAGAEKLLQFERLLSQISATCINLPSREIEVVIRSDLGRLGRFLEGDRCNLCLLNHVAGRIEYDLPYTWWREEDDRFMKGIVHWSLNDPGYFDNFRYYFGRKGEMANFRDAGDLPRQAEGLKDARFGVKSLLGVPISMNGQVVGALEISTVHSRCIWPEEIISRLCLVLGETGTGKGLVASYCTEQTGEKIAPSCRSPVWPFRQH